MEPMMTTINLSVLYPEIIIALFALIVLLLQSFADFRGKKYFGYISLGRYRGRYFYCFFQAFPL